MLFSTFEDHTPSTKNYSFVHQNMSPTFDAIADNNCKNDRKIWRFRVRIVRLWRVPNFKQPDQPDFIDMVLMDEKVLSTISFLLLSGGCRALLYYLLLCFLSVFTFSFSLIRSNALCGVLLLRGLQACY